MNKANDRVSRGECRICGQPLVSKTLCGDCLAYMRLWHKKRKERGGTCRNCNKSPVPGRKLCVSCENSQRAYTQKIKDYVYHSYGGYVCVCCGEKEHAFLSIDHINNDGAEHRRMLMGGDKTKICRWLKRNNCPPGFQVLCYNCQRGKFLFGTCPHRQHGEFQDYSI